MLNISYPLQPHKDIPYSSLISIPELQHELNQKKSDIALLRKTLQSNSTNNSQPNIQTITKCHYKKWYTTVFSQNQKLLC